MNKYNLCIRELKSLLGSAKELEVRAIDAGTPYTDGEADAARTLQAVIAAKIETVEGMREFAEKREVKLMESEYDGK